MLIMFVKMFLSLVLEAPDYIRFQYPMNFNGKDIFFVKSQKHLFKTVLFKRNSIIKILKIRFFVFFLFLWHYSKNIKLGVKKTWIPTFIHQHISYVYREFNKSF